MVFYYSRPARGKEVGGVRIWDSSDADKTRPLKVKVDCSCAFSLFCFSFARFSATKSKTVIEITIKCWHTSTTPHLSRFVFRDLNFLFRCFLLLYFFVLFFSHGFLFFVLCFIFFFFTQSVVRLRSFFAEKKDHNQYDSSVYFELKAEI